MANGFDCQSQYWPCKRSCLWWCVSVCLSVALRFCLRLRLLPLLMVLWWGVFPLLLLLLRRYELHKFPGTFVRAFYGRFPFYYDASVCTDVCLCACVRTGPGACECAYNIIIKWIAKVCPWQTCRARQEQLAGGQLGMGNAHFWGRKWQMT